jgi:hypothetical protein
MPEISGNFSHRAHARAVRDAKRALFSQKSAPLAERLARLSESRPRAEREWLRSCLAALSRETQEENYYSGLLNVAIRLKADLREEAAEMILEFIAQSEVPEEIRRRAQLERGALRGEGTFGMQAESFFSRLVDGNSNLRAIVPLIGTTVVGQAAGSVIFGGLARAGWSGLFGGVLRKKLAAGFGALALEIPTLVGLNHLFSPAPGSDLGREILQTGVSLGVFRGVSGVRQFIAAGRPLAAGINQLIHSSTTFLGLLASDYLVNGKASSSDAFFSLLHLVLGNELGRGVLGGRFAALQNEWRLRSQVPRNGSHGDFARALQGWAATLSSSSPRWEGGGKEVGIQQLFMKSWPSRRPSVSSIEKIQRKIAQEAPLSSEEARKIIREILDSSLPGDVLPKYQALVDIAVREDFEDFSALMRALARLGERQHPIAYAPLVEWFWGSGLPLSEVPGQMDLQRIKARFVGIFEPTGDSRPLSLAIPLDEKPPDLGDLRIKMESPTVANAVVLTELFAALAEYQKLRRAKNFRFLIQQLRRQGEILREAGVHELGIGRGLSRIIGHRRFAGTRNIEEFLKALPYASGSRSTGFNEPQILQGLLAHPDFSLDLDLMSVLNFLNDHIADPVARLFLLGDFGGDPQFRGEQNFQLLFYEFKQSSVGFLMPPTTEDEIRYRKILAATFGQVAANPRLTKPSFALELLLEMGLSPEESGAPFLRIAGNRHFRDGEGFRRMGEILLTIKQPALRDHYFQQLVFNPRLAEAMRQKLLRKYGEVDLHGAARLHALLAERKRLQ